MEKHQLTKVDELKTLKDFITDEDDPAVAYNNDLKQEAIKWIKAIDNRMEIGGAFDEFSHDGSSDIPDWIKHFFNIKEEDLKC